MLLLRFAPRWIIFEGMNWVIELTILVFIFMILWVFVCVRGIRYFWKFPMPVMMGNAIAAGPYRNRVQPSSMVVEALQAKPGMTVVEIGCGSGLFTIAVAKAIRPDGIVYAVDIQEDMLEKLRNRMDSEDVDNVVPILADAGNNIELDDGIADAVFSVTVLPEIPEPIHALRQIKRLLKVGGIYADAELFLDPDYPLRQTITRWAKQAGLIPVGEMGNFFRYVMIFKKNLE